MLDRDLGDVPGHPHEGHDDLGDTAGVAFAQVHRGLEQRSSLLLEGLVEGLLPRGVVHVFVRPLVGGVVAHRLEGGIAHCLGDLIRPLLDVGFGLGTLHAAVGGFPPGLAPSPHVNLGVEGHGLGQLVHGFEGVARGAYRLPQLAADSGLVLLDLAG